MQRKKPVSARKSLGQTITNPTLSLMLQQNNSPLTPTPLNSKILVSDRLPSLHSLQLSEAILFLQKKIGRQGLEIKMLGEQLSTEIGVKEEALRLLGEEKERNLKSSGSLANANKTISELRKKITKAEKDLQGMEVGEKEDYEMKVSKYKEIIRKKDEQLSKHQQRIAELAKHEIHIMGIEHELKSLRESFIRLKSREDGFVHENEGLKKKLGEALERSRDKEHSIMLGEEKARRVEIQYNELSEQYQEESREAQNIEGQMKDLITLQNKEIEMLRDELDKLMAQRDLQLVKRRSLEQADINDFKGVYHKELRRVLNDVVKDGNLRKRIQKQMGVILSEMEGGYEKVFKEYSSFLMSE